MMDDSSLPFPEEPFSRSSLIPTSRIKSTGAFTQFAARLSTSDHLADSGAMRARNDYATIVGHPPSSDGGASTAGNFNGLLYFDCLPDRIEILAYLNELAFLHDGIYAPYTYPKTLMTDISQTTLRWMKTK
jgi:hypothetical protein